jgi:hypothetical protein
MDIWGPLPGDKSWPGRDSDQSPPCSAEVENENELCLLPTPAPSWLAVGQLWLLAGIHSSTTGKVLNLKYPSNASSLMKEPVQKAEKKLKYKNLSIEIHRMWNMKCFVIPVIIGATGIVSRSLQKKYLEQYQDNT